MTRYADFEKLKDLTKLTKTDRGYSKFIQTGDLEFYDYGTGFIDLSIYAFVGRDRVPRVRLWFGTVDDSDFGGWLDCNTLEEAQDVVEQIANNVFKDMIAFPTHEEINGLLVPWCIVVNYE